MRLETSGYYALLIPIFAVLLGAEYLLGRRRGWQLYTAADTVSDLLCGLGQILCGVFTGPVVLWLYAFTFHHCALVGWPPGSVLPWLIALVGVDFCYYWFHRAGHRVALLWAIHSVHHQSEEYNLAVALRQPWFSDLSALLFYWPLPLLGIAEGPFFAAVAVLSIYQVTLHTRLCGRPGRLGSVFNTPSHHRVHHGQNRRYADRNFGATLILWDHLFGTFQGEDEPVRYGVAGDYPDYDPVAAQCHVMRDLLARARTASGPLARLRVLLGPPRAPEGMLRGGKDPKSLSRTWLLAFVALLVASLSLLWRRAALPPGLVDGGTVALLLCLGWLGRTLAPA